MGQTLNVSTLRRQNQNINLLSSETNFFLYYFHFMNVLKKSLTRKNIFVANFDFNFSNNSIFLSTHIFFKTVKIRKFRLKKKVCKIKKKYLRQLKLLWFIFQQQILNNNFLNSQFIKYSYRKLANIISLRRKKNTYRALKSSSLKKTFIKKRNLSRFKKISFERSKLSNILRFRCVKDNFRLRRDFSSLKSIYSNFDQENLVASSLKKKNLNSIYNKHGYQTLKVGDFFFKQFRALKKNSVTLIIYNLNKQVNVKLTKYLYHRFKRFTNVLFSRQSNLFFDFIKL
jgi:hypothetical protein